MESVRSVSEHDEPSFVTEKKWEILMVLAPRVGISTGLRGFIHRQIQHETHQPGTVSLTRFLLQPEHINAHFCSHFQEHVRQTQQRRLLHRHPFSVEQVEPDAVR